MINNKQHELFYVSEYFTSLHFCWRFILSYESAVYSFSIPHDEISIWFWVRITVYFAFWLRSCTLLAWVILQSVHIHLILSLNNGLFWLRSFTLLAWVKLKSIHIHLILSLNNGLFLSTQSGTWASVFWWSSLRIFPRSLHCIMFTSDQQNRTHQQKHCVYQINCTALRAHLVGSYVKERS